MAVLAVVILFLALVITGQVIAEGVAEEKRSRVVEVVLGTVAPRHLLIGKAAAIGLIGLVRGAPARAAAVAAAGVALDAFALPRATAGALVAVVGLVPARLRLLRHGLRGGRGSWSPRTRTRRNATFPVTLLLMVGYFAGLSAPGRRRPVHPGALAAPAHRAADHAAAHRLRRRARCGRSCLSVVLTLAAAYGMIRLGARLYAGALMRGGRVRWRDAWRDAAHLG